MPNIMNPRIFLFLKYQPLLIIGIISAFLLNGCNFTLTEDITPPPSLKQFSATRLPVVTPEIESQGLQSTLQPAGTNIPPNLNREQLFVDIRGSIKNQSKQELPKNLIVELHGFNQNVEVYTKDVSILPDGTYLFEQVNYSPGWIFIASITINGITYYSSDITPASGESSLDMPITIFATTTDLTVLTVSRLHIFLSFPTRDTLRVVELFIISNHSPYTIISNNEAGTIVPFGVPRQANNLQIQDGYLGGRFQKIENGFADTLPIQPGENQYQVMFAFDLPYSQKLEISQPVLIPIQNIVIMVPQNDRFHSLRLKGEFQKSPELRKIQNIEYQSYLGKNIQSGTKLSFLLLDEPSDLLHKQLPSFITETFADPRLLFGVAFFGLVLVGTGIWLWITDIRMKKRGIMQEENEIKDDNYQDANEVIDAIIALDDIYKDGDLPEKAYNERRSRLKARLSDFIENREA